MGMNIAQKLMSSHIVSGTMKKGSELSLHIDQTLTQDATGTMAYLQFEAMGIERVKTEKSVAYIDHNTLQSGFENADDHRYIQTVCKKHGIWFSRPGNGICHQVHLERFGKPGKTLLGSDSHTPTGGGIGMLAMGAGGLDVAVAMGGGEYFITCPGIIRINLTGSLRPMVGAKDIILEVLRRIGVKGGVGYILEYSGEGVKGLSVPQRATITNMGTETGATTSVFPADETTRAFLAAQGREGDYTALCADKDALYDDTIDIDLSKLGALAAMPHSPDNVKPVSEIKGLPISQVCIGSCTNSSYLDLMTVAAILKGRTVNSNVSLTVSPGSKQVYNMLAANGALADIIDAGARVLECACGPCIGMGQSPRSGGVSLRTFNRNFEGRSGTEDAKVYLVSPETAAVSALHGVLSDPTQEKINIYIAQPVKFAVNDNLIDAPAANAAAVTVERGPNIKPFPLSAPLGDNISTRALLIVGDNITTDHIMPAGSKILPYRSNIPKLSEFCFVRCDPEFPARAKEWRGGIIIGGSNYGQGSSREHAALVPLYLGVKAVIAKSFARIHAANLINNGIIPITFKNASDYECFALGDELELPDIRKEILNSGEIVIKNKTNGSTITGCADLSERQKHIICAGGLINYTKER